MKAQALVLVALVMASGCATRGGESLPPTTGTDAAPRGVLVPNNATACSRVFPAVFVDLAHAQSFLPKGFRAADSSKFFGMSGVPNGRALLIVSMMKCASSQAAPSGYDEAMAGLFIDPPRLNGRPVPGEHFYDLGRTFGRPGLGAALEEVGWARLGQTVAVSYEGEPGRGASATIADMNGTVFSASLPAAGVRDTFTSELHLYWWHQTKSGLGSIEYRFRIEGWLGTGSCTARAGSTIALVLGKTTCDSALFMVGPPFSVVSRLEFRPDVQVEP